MRTHYSTLRYAKQIAMKRAGKTGNSQIIFQMEEDYVVIPRSEGARNTCIRTAEILGATYIDEIQVLK